MSLSLEKKQGLTLVELLAVIAIIAILLTLSFAGVAGMMEKSRRDSAKLEMEIIEQALEDYKMRFGDYPKELATYPSPLSSPEELMFNSLMGKLNPNGGATFVKPMLNHAPLDLAGGVPNPNNNSLVATTVVDPWGQAYQYRYNPGNSLWENYGYLLYSMGPDGSASASPASGIQDPQGTSDEDNIYAR